MHDDSPMRRTDQELLVAKLTLDDPANDPDLCEDPPPVEGEVIMDGDYHLPGDADRVRCNNCAQRTAHKNGWRIRIGDHKYLIGSECGPKYFNLSFEAAARSHKKARERQTYLQRLSDLYGQSDRIRASLRNLIDCPELRLLTSKRQELTEASPDLVLRLRSFCIAGTPLSETIRLRDFEAESRRSDDDPNQTPIYRFETAPIGQLAGSALLVEIGTCEECARDIIVALKMIDLAGAELKYCGNVQYSTAQLKALVMDVERRLITLKEAIARVDSAHQFFSPANLDRIQRWAASLDQFAVRVSGDNLIVRAANKETVVQPLLALRLPAVAG